jgi:methylenetetrahydrofolate dehydrogenase (NADP+)/methenyltetrahydrofolate cyclohydrolase
MTNSSKARSVSDLASNYRDAIRDRVKALDRPPKLLGFLSSDRPASKTYSEYTASGCADVGIEFELLTLDRLAIEPEVLRANEDPTVDGILIYYPIFSAERDGYIRGIVDPRKDVEGLNQFWLRKLYDNDRFYGAERKRKAILPCTPLAILKTIENTGVGEWSSKLPLDSLSVTIFNRSEVVGRPLAHMMANDGATVFSFDIDGGFVFAPDGSSTESSISRKEALKQSDIVVTGVPSQNFDLVRVDELRGPDVVCLNFSTSRNFEPEVRDYVEHYIPRVGPVTIAMCLRNTLRLYENFKADKS